MQSMLAVINSSDIWSLHSLKSQTDDLKDIQERQVNIYKGCFNML